MAGERFDEKCRQPIIPLSIEDINIAKAREFVIDYKNNQAFIKINDGRLLSITESTNILEYFKQYLLNHPEILLSVTIIDEDGNTTTLQETFDDIFNKMTLLNKKEYLYAGSATAGGSASVTEKVNHSFTITDSGGYREVFDSTQDKAIDIGSRNMFSKSGGFIDGSMLPKKKFLLKETKIQTEIKSYGMRLPDTGTEGQIFILLKEEV